MDKNIKQKVKKIVAPVRLLGSYLYDLKNFRDYSFEFNSNNLSKDNLRADITFQYHALEKGMCHNRIRLGYGLERRKRLLYLLRKWSDNNYQLDDKRYATGVAVLKRYIEMHEENNFDVSSLKEEVGKLPIGIENILGGYEEKEKEYFINARNKNFEQFSKSRRSIRDYGEDDVTVNEIEEAIELSTLYPSVCNRQAVRTYVIMSKEKMMECLKLQNGIQGMAQNIRSVIVVTSDNSYFGNLNERNQNFIDGGIFSMNLLYSLTYKNIAACALNANMNTKNIKKMKDLIGINKSEDIIMFISCGSYPEKIKYPISNRDSSHDIMSIIR